MSCKAVKKTVLNYQLKKKTKKHFYQALEGTENYLFILFIENIMKLLPYDEAIKEYAEKKEGKLFWSVSGSYYYF